MKCIIIIIFIKSSDCISVSQTALQRSRRMWSTEYHSQSTTPPLVLTCEYIFAHVVKVTDMFWKTTWHTSCQTFFFKFIGINELQLSSWNKFKKKLHYKHLKPQTIPHKVEPLFYYSCRVVFPFNNISFYPFHLFYLF